MIDFYDSKNKYTKEDIIKMFQFLVDKIFVFFAVKVLQYRVGIPISKNCASLRTDLVLSLELRSGIHTVFALGRQETVSFPYKCRYIDD